MKLVDIIAQHLKDKEIDIIVGPEARGFIFGSAKLYMHSEQHLFQ